MADVKLTRSELIKLNKKIKLATSGHSLLKRKRDGLIKEFFDVLEQAKKSSTQLGENYKKSLQSINLARAIEGTIAVKSAALARERISEIEVKTKNVMGIVVPAIKSGPVIRKPEERGYGLLGISEYVDDAAEAFEELVENIIVAAEIETTLRKLLNEIDKTKRRVNALEFRVIPGMSADAKFIRFRLEELERDDIFRLKRIKAKVAK